MMFSASSRRVNCSQHGVVTASALLPTPEAARPRRRDVLGLLTATLLALGLLVVPQEVAAEPGDVGIESLSHVGTNTPTGTKRAESVLWFNDGLWWGNLWDEVSSYCHIFRFDPVQQKWLDTGCGDGDPVQHPS